MQSGEGTLQTWDSWSSLLTRSGPKYPIDRCRSLIESYRNGMIAVIASKGCAKNIKLSSPTIISVQASFIVSQFRLFFKMILLNHNYFCQFVSYFKWPLCFFLTEGYQQLWTHVYIALYCHLVTSVWKNSLTFFSFIYISGIHWGVEPKIKQEKHCTK